MRVIIGFSVSIRMVEVRFDSVTVNGRLEAKFAVDTTKENTYTIRSADASSITGNTIYANTTVLDSDANDNIEFSITLNLTTGTLITITNDNLTS